MEGGTENQHPSLPAELSEPMIYLSVRQRAIIAKHPLLAACKLPCWVPARTIADALGYDHSGIELALSTTGRPYLWATELENVHTLWRYREPAITVEGKNYSSVEEFFHAQKPRPFDDAEWCARREAVMEAGLRAKLAADPTVRTLLLSTAPHPLLSLKADRTWGFDPRRGGRNQLAQLWEKLRAELMLADE